MKKVEVYYNPYQSTSKIIIDGNREDLTLRRFENMSFNAFYKQIFQAIDRVIEDKYILEYTGSLFEIELLKNMKFRSQYCSIVRGHTLKIKTSPDEKAEAVLNLAKDKVAITPDKIKLLFFCCGFENNNVIKSSVDSCFKKHKISNGLWDFQPIYISNISELRKYEGDLNVLFVIYKSKADISSSMISYMADNRFKYIFAIQTFSSEEFARYDGEELEENENYLTLIQPNVNLSGSIYDCLQFGSITDIFKSCYEHFSSSVNSYEDFRNAFSVNPPIKLEFPETVEPGESFRPVILEGDSNDIIYRSGRADIIEVRNDFLYPKTAGECKIYALEKSSSLIIAEHIICVKQKICVNDMIFSDTVLQSSKKMTAAIGTSIKADISYFPENAENWNSRIWKSSDVNVASVDSNGNIKVISTGCTQITCKVGDISIGFELTAEDKLREIRIINIKDDRLDIQRGLIYKLDISTVPQSAIDKELVVLSSNTEVAKISGFIVRAVGLGESVITVQNKNGGVKKSFGLTVTGIPDEKIKLPRKKLLGIF